jgi:hypothetical protein
MEDSFISRAIRRMARKACGLPEEEERGRRVGVLGWARRSLTKARAGEEVEDAMDDGSAIVPRPA